MPPLRVAAALLLAFCLLPAEASAADPVVLSTGHVDALDVVYEDGALGVEVKDDTVEPSVHRELDDVLFHAKPQAEVTIPDGLPDSYAFIGTPGDPVWILPMTQDPDLLWPGWETMRVPGGVIDGERLDMRLLDVEGPGRIQLWVDDHIGEAILLLNSADGLPDSTPLSTRTHMHMNWAFGARGLYTLTWEVTGRLTGGAPITSGPVKQRFLVGSLADLPPSLPATTLTVDGYAPEYAPGAQVALHAVQAPDTGLTDYRWQAQCGDDPAFADVGGGAAHAFAATPAHDGCRYRVLLRGPRGATVATSEPVTIRVHRATQPASPPAAAGPPAATADAPFVVTVARARLHGRRLTFRVQLAQRTSLDVAVRHRGRRIARPAAQSAGSSRGRVRFHLPRRLAAGRYTLKILARAGSRTLTRTLTLHVR